MNLHVTLLLPIKESCNSWEAVGVRPPGASLGKHPTNLDLRLQQWKVSSDLSHKLGNYVRHKNLLCAKSTTPAHCKSVLYQKQLKYPRNENNFPLICLRKPAFEFIRALKAHFSIIKATAVRARCELWKNNWTLEQVLDMTARVFQNNSDCRTGRFSFSFITRSA